MVDIDQFSYVGQNFQSKLTEIHLSKRRLNACICIQSQDIGWIAVNQNPSDSNRLGIYKIGFVNGLVQNYSQVFVCNETNQ